MGAGIKMTAEATRKNEAKLEEYIARIGQAPDEREAKGLMLEASGWLSGMVEFNGYSTLQAEAWSARLKKAKTARVRQLNKGKPKPSTNVHGLDVHYFRTKMERMLRGLGSYTPDEFARECARMSMTAEATVLNEPEFDRYR